MCRQHFFVVVTFFTNGRNKEGSIYYFNKASKSTCVNHNTVPSGWSRTKLKLLLFLTHCEEISPKAALENLAL